METRVNVEEGKKYLYVETTEEGIKQFKNAPEAERAGIEISKMRVEGVWVPAFKFAVEISTELGAQFYADWKQEEWRQESQYRMENRCEICGSNGKSMRCPLRVRRISERLSNLGIDYQQLDSDASIKKWNAGQLQVGLIHPASAGHGLNLQSGGNILVWFGITWSLELYQQTVARLWRQGQTEGTVSVIHIVTDGTVDERILKALEAKDLTQSALIDAVKAEVGDGK